MDYNIGLRRGLLEAKHYLALREAVWLYSVLIDWQTSDDGSVKGGKPITYDMVAEVLPISRSTYCRWIKQLRPTYIKAKQVTGGLVIHIANPQKHRRSVKNDTAKEENTSDVSKVTQQNDNNRLDVSEMTQQDNERCVNNDAADVSEMTHLYKDTIQITKQTKPIINKDPKKPSKALALKNSLAQQLVDYWEAVTGDPPDGGNEINFYAACDLLKKNSFESVKAEIEKVPQYRMVPFAPSINNLLDLTRKRNALKNAIARAGIQHITSKRKSGGRNAEYLRNKHEPAND